MKNNTDDQRLYFENKVHRFNSTYIKTPTTAQTWEYHEIINEIRRIDSNRVKVLDFGCGSGRLTIALLREGIDVHGMDISQNSLDELTSYVLQNRTSHWGKLTTSTSLPINKFDAIVGADVLHHVDLPQTLSLLYKKLNKSGVMVFSEPNALYPLWYIHYWIRNIPWNIEKGILQCTLRTIRHVCINNGFKNFEIQGFGLLLPVTLTQYMRFLKQFSIETAKRYPNLSMRFRIIIKN